MKVDKLLKEVNELLKHKFYQITVEGDRKEYTGNINIDRPMFETIANDEGEAISKMMKSDWSYKNNKILNIYFW